MLDLYEIFDNLTKRVENFVMTNSKNNRFYNIRNEKRNALLDMNSFIVK